MAAKPHWREFDSMPRRGDDIRLSFMGASIEANGRTVVIVICAVVIALLGIAGWWMSTVAQENHDERTARDHTQLITTIEVMTCVLTLNEFERKEFRQTGRYCGGYNDNVGIRKHVTE